MAVAGIVPNGGYVDEALLEDAHFGAGRGRNAEQLSQMRRNVVLHVGLKRSAGDSGVFPASQARNLLRNSAGSFSLSGKVKFLIFLRSHSRQVSVSWNAHMAASQSIQVAGAS